MPPGWANPIRVTLAWDDLPYDPAVDQGADTRAPKLINDLDLLVVDPNGIVHYPWQLNQIVRDENQNSIPDDQQHCGTTYTVSGQIQPQPTTSAGQPDGMIPLTGFPPAIHGKDHLNNVEVVDVPPPQRWPAVLGVLLSPFPQPAGNWTIQVTGFSITTNYGTRPVGPQRFSLLGPFPLSLAPEATPPAAPSGVRVQ